MGKLAKVQKNGAESNLDSSTNCSKTVSCCCNRSRKRAEDLEEYCRRLHNTPNYWCIERRNFAENAKAIEALVSCGRRSCNPSAPDGDENRPPEDTGAGKHPQDKILPNSIYIPTSCVLPYCKCFKPYPHRKKRRKRCCYQCPQPCQQLQQKYCFIPQNNGDCTPCCQPQFCGQDCNNTCQRPEHCSDTANSNDIFNRDHPHIKDTLLECDNYNTETPHTCGRFSPEPENKCRPISKLMQSNCRETPKRHSSDDWKSQIEFSHIDNSAVNDAKCECPNNNHFKDCTCLMCQRRRCRSYVCPKITDRDGQYCRPRSCTMQLQECNNSGSNSGKNQNQCDEEGENKPKPGSFSRILRDLNKNDVRHCTGKPDCPCVVCCKRRSYSKIKPHNWYSNGLENPTTKYKRMTFPLDGNNNFRPGTGKGGETHTKSLNDDMIQHATEGDLDPNDFEAGEDNPYAGSGPQGNDNNPNEDEEQQNCETYNKPQNPCRKSFGLDVTSRWHQNQPQDCNNSSNFDCNGFMAPQELQCCNNHNEMSCLANCGNCGATEPSNQCRRRHICDRYPRFFKRMPYCWPCEPCCGDGNGDECIEQDEDHCGCPPPAPTNYNTTIYRSSYGKPGVPKRWLKHKFHVDEATCDDSEQGLFPVRSPAPKVHPDDEGWSDGKPRYRRGRQYGGKGTFPDTFKIFTELDDRRAAAFACPNIQSACENRVTCRKCEPTCIQRICNDRRYRMPMHIEYKHQTWPGEPYACCCADHCSMFDRYCSSCPYLC